MQGRKKKDEKRKRKREKEKRRKEIIVKKPTYGVRLTIKEGAKERAKKGRVKKLITK